MAAHPSRHPGSDPTGPAISTRTTLANEGGVLRPGIGFLEVRGGDLHEGRVYGPQRVRDHGEPHAVISQGGIPSSSGPSPTRGFMRDVLSAQHVHSRVRGRRRQGRIPPCPPRIIRQRRWRARYVRRARPLRKTRTRRPVQPSAPTPTRAPTGTMAGLPITAGRLVGRNLPSTSAAGSHGSALQLPTRTSSFSTGSSISIGAASDNDRGCATSGRSDANPAP